VNTGVKTHVKTKSSSPAKIVLGPRDVSVE
jgi:hypothetical protein